MHVLSAEPQVTEDPCVPNPCGRYSECTNSQGQARCACTEGYFGSPPNCRPECLLSSDCPPQMACIRQKCSDPCTGICGSNALCRAVNHRSICSCPPDFTGDPFVSCNKQAGILHLAILIKNVFFDQKILMSSWASTGVFPLVIFVGFLGMVLDPENRPKT